MKNIFNSIIGIIKKTALVYKEKLPHLVFLVLLLAFFILIRQLPYINIFPHYYNYVFLIYLVIPSSRRAIWAGSRSSSSRGGGVESADPGPMKPCTA